MKERYLIPGDKVRESTLRDSINLGKNKHTCLTWRTNHHTMFGEFIYVQHYKNSDIREYQKTLIGLRNKKQLNSKDFHAVMPIMKMHLQGGSAQPLGQTCLSVHKLRQYSAPASSSLPKPQDLASNNANHRIIDACAVSQAISVFAPLLIFPNNDKD